ncbi:MAG: TonB-dependent receptor plug domain-containing protein [Alphaproteobacteria bacterium]
MRRFWLCWLIIFTLLLPLCAVAQADEGEDDEEEEVAEPGESDIVFTPGEIVVVGRRTPAEMTGTVTEIDAEDIRQLGAQNAADALRIITGTRVDAAPTSLSANGKQEQLASLRGFDARHVIVLIDGVPMYEPYFRVLDLRQIPVGDIAKIKVIKGPTSVLYGPNALGGVINIITKRGAGRPRGHFDASYGDVQTFLGNASALGGYRNWEYFVSSGFAAGDGFRIAEDFGATRNEDGELRENSDYRDLVLAGKLGYFNGLNGLAISANHYQFEGGVPFSMEAIEPGTLWRKKWRKTSVAMHGELTPTDYLYIRARAFYTRFFNTITTYTDTSMSAVAVDGDAVSTYDNDVFGYILMPELLMDEWGTLTFSLLYKNDQVSIQDEDGAEWYDFAAETYSGGAEYGVHFFRFDFTAGAAYHFYRRYETPEEQLGEDNDAVDYQAGLAYAPAAGLTLRIAAAHKSAFPDLKTLYGSQGNPDLKPEYAYNFDAGVRFNMWAPLTLEATYFYSDITDLIGKRDLGNEFFYENIDEATLSGLESSLGFTFFDDQLYLGANHTYLQTTDEREERKLKSLDFRPEHMFNLDGRMYMPWGTTLSVQFYYVDERQYEVPGNERNVRTMPEYGLTNARLGHTFAWDEGRTSCELFFQGYNLFDVYYEQAPEKASAGRTLMAGLALDF